MKRLLCVVGVLLTVVSASAEVGQSPAPTLPDKSIYIAPTGDGFEVYIAAAINKKKVPVTVVEKPEDASYTLKAAQVEVEKVSTGSKWAKCIFAYCAGTEDKASTSVQLMKDGVVAWSYSVNKGRGAKNRQSMAEAIAKHLKDEYFKR